MTNSYPLEYFGGSWDKQAIEFIRLGSLLQNGLSSIRFTSRSRESFNPLSDIRIVLENIMVSANCILPKSIGFISMAAVMALIVAVGPAPALASGDPDELLTLGEGGEIGARQ